MGFGLVNDGKEKHGRRLPIQNDLNVFIFDIL